MLASFSLDFLNQSPPCMPFHPTNYNSSIEHSIEMLNTTVNVFTLIIANKGSSST